jgi:zinc transporter
MRIFSIVTAIFLPLGLITGLLGINVGGIPGADHIL